MTWFYFVIHQYLQKFTQGDVYISDLVWLYYLKPMNFVWYLVDDY